MKEKFEFEKIKNLLISWEDGNMTDYEYIQKMSKILKLGNWTHKGANGN